MKKIVALLLVFALCASFAACKKSGLKEQSKDEVQTWYFAEKDKEDVKADLDAAKETVNPAQIFSSTKYTEDMLYGVYAVNDLEKDIKSLSKEYTFEDVTFDNGTFNISSVPVAVCSGAKYLFNSHAQFSAITDKPVASLRFISGDKIGNVPCTYEINGNTIKYTTIVETTKKGEAFSYKEDKVVFEYQFSLSGPHLTLTKGEESITLTAFSFTDNNKSTASMLHAYSTEKTPLVGSLDYFFSQQDSIINVATKRDGNYYDTFGCKLTSDGRITLLLSEKDDSGKENKIVKDFAYIAQSSGLPFLNTFSLILLDGEKTYFYTDSSTDREERILASEGLDTEKMEEEKIKEIAEKKSDLYDDLMKEFESAGIPATINRSNGEIIMDATVLFGGDSAKITDEGKSFLDKFVQIYSRVIFNEKYNGFITKTMVEGHVAPLAGSTYDSGLPLSKERAQNVLAYCSGKDAKLGKTLEAIGYSNSRPIYDSDGNVDLDACRRVSFKCVVNPDKA